MKYTEAVKKYKNLPSWDKIKKIYKVEEDDFYEVVKVITREFRGLSDYLESMITASYYKVFVERNFLDEKDKKTLVDMYKEIQILLINERLARLDYSEKKYAEWVKEAVNLWDKFRPKLKKILEKLKAGWKKYEVKMNNEEDMKYHF